MKYFVTGATGFIGGRVATQLLAAGHSVVTLARTPSKAAGLAQQGVVVHAGDITDKASLRAPMTGVDGIFHIAGWYKIGQRHAKRAKRDAERINIAGTRNVLEVMRELGIPKGVYTSTCLVYSDTHGQTVDETYAYHGPWLSDYERTKWTAHFEVADPMIQQGLPLVIVQPDAVYGPGDTSQTHDLLVRYLQRQLPIAPPKTALCWTHVDDIAAGHLLAMERGQAGQSYILAGVCSLFVDLLRLAETITGIPAPRLQPPPALLKLSAAMIKPLEAFLPVPPLFGSESLRSIAGVTYTASDRKARQALGFTARSLEDGLSETLIAELTRLKMAPALAHARAYRAGLALAA